MAHDDGCSSRTAHELRVKEAKGCLDKFAHDEREAKTVRDVVGSWSWLVENERRKNKFFAKALHRLAREKEIDPAAFAQKVLKLAVLNDFDNRLFDEESVL